jgi:FlaA1/EpsC-like NDP-sugar epimerase
LTDLASGKVNEDALREIDIEDLLGRESVAPIPELLCQNITGKTVLVTGSGGSIGSELCRQIAFLAPRQLILIDINEFALYTIHEELKSLSAKHSFELTPILANILEAENLTRIFSALKPQTVYHAAAYKHVPLVEANPVAGLRNNVLGTLAVAQAALHAKVQDMVMISTDKAVRPTNVMGASKRLAEMVLQSLAHQHAGAPQSTRFCIVRFGNVLGSSGSVVPKFREQIQQGGPITVTHADVTRFFMTIPEAAQLVLQAGAMQQSHHAGAHVYLLDMGESVKIIDLAKLMVQLSGLTVRDHEKPEGDIEIHTVGLRPGEKLYEELLIAENSKPTRHSKIRSAQEEFVPLDQILALINSVTEYSEHESHTPQQQLTEIRRQIKPLVQLHDSTA